MKNKNTLIILFLFVAMAQLFVPAQMIYNQEDILNTGKIIKFQCEPIDPNDPFRGKFITLNFKESGIKVKNLKGWNRNETVFAKIETSKDGFAKIKSISKTEPKDNSIYLKLKINYIADYDNENKICRRSLCRIYNRHHKNSLCVGCRKERGSRHKRCINR